MPTYRITIVERSRYAVDIEASSLDEALREANDINEEGAFDLATDLVEVTERDIESVRAIESNDGRREKSPV